MGIKIFISKSWTYTMFGFMIFHFSARTYAKVPQYFSDEEIKLILQDYNQNSFEFHQKLPPKKFIGITETSGDRPGVPGNALIPKIGIKDKLNFRKRFFLNQSLSENNDDSEFTFYKSAFAANDRVENLLEHPKLEKNIFSLVERKLQQGEISSQPWSDSYWPIYRGILGARYADEQFNDHYEWSALNKYIQDFPALNIYKEGNLDKVNKLSPSEKYDLLTSTENSPLTKALWNEGKMYNDRNGSVESWMGICHGWAPAAYMTLRPLNKVTVMSADGKTPITFYPSDIKSLISLLWAKANTQSRFIGGRCHSENPKVDTKTGRSLEQDCFDNNPASWHLSIVNKIGLYKESFVMDATYDYEVWNQPVISYSYKYFNVKTSKPVEKLEDAIVKLSDYPEDKYKSYRSPEAKSIVGITMETTYLLETEPVQRDEDSQKYDYKRTTIYVYDLELDEKGGIIGGEWYQNHHPDFLWTPTLNSKPLSYNDYFLLGEKLWDGKNKLPPLWMKKAKESSERGLPIYKIVESLLNLSQKPQ